MPDEDGFEVLLKSEVNKRTIYFENILKEKRNSDT